MRTFSQKLLAVRETMEYFKQGILNTISESIGAIISLLFYNAVEPISIKVFRRFFEDFWQIFVLFDEVDIRN